MGWSARKAVARGPGYLPRRVSYPIKRSLVDRVFPTPAMRARAELERSLGEQRPDEVRRHFVSREHPRWHFGPREIDRVAAALDATQRARTLEAADDLLENRFAFRGGPALALEPLAWEPPDANLGFVWDLNRHNWFVTLGLAYAHTGDGRYARKFADASASWVATNGGKLGRMEWDGPFEVAARINAWIWAHSLLCAAPEWPTADYLEFIRTLGLLAEYLNQTIEFHDSGNHLLLEAKTLALCGEAFPEFRGAGTWRPRSWAVLRRELERQVSGDGVHAERSTMYQRIVGGELAELWCQALANDRSGDRAVGDVVRRMAAFQSAIERDAGPMPLWGDAFDEDTYYRFSARALVDAVDLGTLPEVSDPQDLTPWVAQRWTRDGGQPRGRPLRSSAFREGGYFVSRSGSGSDAAVLVWDCGPVGARGNTKHAHLDALAFTLALRGARVLIDPGSSPDDERRDFLRSTRAHNTVAIDGEDQGVLAARNEIWGLPNARLALWATSPECDVMAGSHDGYARLPEPAWHTRTIVVCHGLYWLIIDRIAGEGRHTAEQRFHFAPSAEVNETGSGAVASVSAEGVRAVVEPIQPAGGAPPAVTLEVGVAELVYGRPEPNAVLVVRHEGTLPFARATVLAPDASVRRACAVDAAAGDVTTVEVDGSEFRHVVCV
ncbi:MAG: alginate lyase family protein, partial [Actinobacteria bacterium]|nr:alginate lyase family protein [Actinomycetota bacterium]